MGRCGATDTHDQDPAHPLRRRNPRGGRALRIGAIVTRISPVGTAPDDHGPGVPVAGHLLGHAGGVRGKAIQRWRTALSAHGTWLAKAGVTPRVAMELMRHTDIRSTTKA